MPGAPFMADLESEFRHLRWMEDQRSVNPVERARHSTSSSQFYGNIAMRGQYVELSQHRLIDKEAERLTSLDSNYRYRWSDAR